MTSAHLPSSRWRPTASISEALEVAKGVERASATFGLSTVHDGEVKHCPQCGAEYRPGFERCPDCDRALVDEPVVEDTTPPEVEHIPREEVFTTGRRIDADMIRGLLEAHGFDARIWASGMGPYRLESAVTEITGVPSPFNAYRVSVPSDDAEEARALIADATEESQVATDYEPTDEPTARSSGMMNVMRSRWAVVAAALFLLAVVILAEPSQP